MDLSGTLADSKSGEGLSSSPTEQLGGGSSRSSSLSNTSPPPRTPPAPVSSRPLEGMHLHDMELLEKHGPVIAQLMPGDVHGEELFLRQEEGLWTETLVTCEGITSFIAIDRNIYRQILDSTSVRSEVPLDVVRRVMEMPKETRVEKDIDVAKRALCGHSFFQQLSEDSLTSLCLALQFRVIPKSTTIFLQGETVSRNQMFYIILKGSVSIHQKEESVAPIARISGVERVPKKRMDSTLQYRRSENYREQFGCEQWEVMSRIPAIEGRPCQATLHAGDTFGERGMIGLSDTRTATVVTREETQVLFLDSEDFARCRSVFSVQMLFHPARLMRLLYKQGSERTDIDLEQLASITGTNNFFKSMDPKCHFEVCRVMKCAQLGPDELVCQQGAMGDAFYIIMSGGVTVHVLENARHVGKAPAGLQSRLTINSFYGPCVRVLRAGDSFGEHSLDHDEPRNASVITHEPTDLLVVNKDDYLRVLKRNTDVRGTFAAKKEFLLKLPYFKNWDDAAVTQLTYYSTSKRYARGERIVSEGQRPTAIYYIACGVVKVLKQTKQASTQITRQNRFAQHTSSNLLEVAILGEKESFGDFAIMQNQEEPYTIIALDDCEVYSLDPTCLETAIDSSTQSLMRAAALQRHRFQKERVAQVNSTWERKLTSTTAGSLADDHRRSPSPPPTANLTGGSLSDSGEGGGVTYRRSQYVSVPWRQPIPRLDLRNLDGDNNNAGGRPRGAGAAAGGGMHPPMSSPRASMFMTARGSTSHGGVGAGPSLRPPLTARPRPPMTAGPRPPMTARSSYRPTTTETAESWRSEQEPPTTPSVTRPSPRKIWFGTERYDESRCVAAEQLRREKAAIAAAKTMSGKNGALLNNGYDVNIADPNATWRPGPVSLRIQPERTPSAKQTSPYSQKPVYTKSLMDKLVVNYTRESIRRMVTRVLHDVH